MALLRALIADDSPQQTQPFLLLLSSAAQSCLSIFRQILTGKARKTGSHILFCLLYQPSSLLPEDPTLCEHIQVHNWVDRVPGYDDNWSDPWQAILDAIEQSMSSLRAVESVS